MSPIRRTWRKIWSRRYTTNITPQKKRRKSKASRVQSNLKRSRIPPFLPKNQLLSPVSPPPHRMYQLVARSHSLRLSQSHNRLRRPLSCSHRPLHSRLALDHDSSRLACHQHQQSQLNATSSTTRI